MKSKVYNDQINQLRVHRQNGDDLRNEKIKLETRRLPVIKEINKIVKEAQAKAELRLVTSRPDIANTILRQQIVDREMNVGNIPAAASQQKKELETRTLLQMSK